MNNEKMKKDIESKIEEIKIKIETGEMESGNAYAFMYGYVSRALMFFIGNFNTDLTGGEK